MKIWERILYFHSCGCRAEGEMICDECVEYYENVPCDWHAESVLPMRRCDCRPDPLAEALEEVFGA